MLPQDMAGREGRAEGRGGVAGGAGGQSAGGAAAGPSAPATATQQRTALRAARRPSRRSRPGAALHITPCSEYCSPKDRTLLTPSSAHVSLKKVTVTSLLISCVKKKVGE